VKKTKSNFREKKRKKILVGRGETLDNAKS
jgi:hypothetical protein